MILKDSLMLVCCRDQRPFRLYSLPELELKGVYGMLGRGPGELISPEIWPFQAPGYLALATDEFRDNKSVYKIRNDGTQELLRLRMPSKYMEGFDYTRGFAAKDDDHIVFTHRSSLYYYDGSDTTAVPDSTVRKLADLRLGKYSAGSTMNIGSLGVNFQYERAVWAYKYAKRVMFCDFDGNVRAVDFRSSEDGEAEVGQAGAEEPSAPDHVGHGGVDEDGPDGEEDEDRGVPDPLGGGAEDDTGCDDRERALEEHELDHGDTSVTLAVGDSSTEGVLETSDESVSGVAEGEGVSDRPPDYPDEGHDPHALGHHGRHALLPEHPAVEQGDGGRHDENEHRAEEHEDGRGSLHRLGVQSCRRFRDQENRHRENRHDSQDGLLQTLQVRSTPDYLSRMFETK